MTNDEKKVNNKTLTFLFLIVGNKYLNNIEESATAKEALETSNRTNSKHNLLHILLLVSNFLNTKMKQSKKMKKYLSKLIQLNCKLTCNGYGSTGKEVVIVVSIELPKL